MGCQVIYSMDVWWERIVRVGFYVYMCKKYLWAFGMIFVLSKIN